MRRLARSALGVLPLMLGVLVLFPATAASADPGCQGQGCEGLMAADEGCQDDAYPVTGWQIVQEDGDDDDKVVYAQGDLWYSPACHAAWGEYNVKVAYSESIPTLYVQAPYGGVERAVPVDIGVTPPIVFDVGDYRTPMVSWDNSVKFCNDAAGGADPDILQENVFGELCSRWR